MRTSTAIALLASAALAIAAPPDKDAIMAKEKAVWQAFKDKKADDFKKLMSPNYMSVYAEGISTLEQETDSMQGFELKSFSFSDFNVVMSDPATAVVTYTAKMEASYEGQDLSGDYNCGSVWQMKNGQWIGIFHTEMKRDSGTAPSG